MVKLTSGEKANQLTKIVNNGMSMYRAFIPKHAVSITGIITGIPTDITDHEIMDDVQCEVPIMGIKRLNRNDENGRKVPGTRVSITFRTTKLPDSIKLFCCATRVYPFNQKIVFCIKCLRYGHKNENCRGKRRCDCGNIHENDVEYDNCDKPRKCLYCKTNSHPSGAAECRETERQKNLKSIMSRQNLTHIEARKLLPITAYNFYEPLGRSDEFPTLAESITGTFNKGKSPKQGRSSASSAYTQIIQQTEQNHSANRNQPRGSEYGKNSKKLITAEPITLSKTSGVALQNPYRVSESEKLKEAIEHERTLMFTEAKQKLQAICMKLYTELRNQTGDDNTLTEWLKQWSRDHLDLESVII